MSTCTHKKNQSQQDWHKADIKAALEKADWTLRKLSVHHGYNPSTLKLTLHRPWPKGQRLIAEAIEEQPEDIWPSRYPQKHSTTA